jgi:hypothetical protein
LVKNILDQLCNASGLRINHNKSTFHYARLEDADLVSFNELFAYNFMELALGFKYLGYFLKADRTFFEDWRWLLIKFENRITHWCNCWLTLGGRCILVKVVLETQSVFWMALATIPVAVLTKIHKLIFNFLWTVGRKELVIHLCSWVLIAKPKPCSWVRIAKLKPLGGWGLRNLFIFNCALAANSL